MPASAAGCCTLPQRLAGAAVSGLGPTWKVGESAAFWRGRLALFLPAPPHALLSQMAVRPLPSSRPTEREHDAVLRLCGAIVVIGRPSPASTCGFPKLGVVAGSGRNSTEIGREGLAGRASGGPTLRRAARSPVSRPRSLSGRWIVSEGDPPHSPPTTPPAYVIAHPRAARPPTNHGQRTVVVS